MKLDDFLKVKQARCVSIGSYSSITAGKEYDVVGVDRDSVLIVNDDERAWFYSYKHFEPVLDSAENPPQDMELTPEFEVDNSVNIQDIGTDILDTNADIKDTPKFKVGSGFYFGLNSKIYIVKKCTDNEIFATDPNDPIELLSLRKIHCCPATQENYERLQATFPDIEFEKPPTQADIDNEAVDKLAQAMKNKLAKKREQGYHGWETCKHGDLVQLLINHVDKGDPIDVANFCAFLFARGEQLTQGGT